MKRILVLPSTDKLLSNLGALTNMVRRIALVAGDITLKYYDGIEIMCVEEKGDGSPVTQADREAEIYIQAELAKLTPDILFIGEEIAASGVLSDVPEAQYFWLVDPLDGTREFTEGGEEFTVNIALVRDGVPILGVVYVPVTGVLYAGYEGGPAIRWSVENEKDRVITAQIPPAKGMIVVASKSHGSRERQDAFLEGFKVAKVVQKSSSLKICVIAEGKGHMYPRFGPTCHWDTAAGDAVLRAAGGTIQDMDGVDLVYSAQTKGFYNPEFVASSFPWSDSGD